MIVIVNYSYDADLRDGRELVARYHSLAGWTRALVDAGAGPVTVVQRFGQDGNLRADGVDYRFVADRAGPGLPALSIADRVAREVARLAPSVVHVNGLIFPLQTRHLRRRLPRATALLVQDHGGTPDGHPGFLRWRWRALHRFGLHGADGFLFTSAALAAPWRRARIIGDRQPVYEVVEASSDLHTAAAADESGAASAGRPALLWVGRLDANKDPLAILDGFERAARSLPDAALTMVYGQDDLGVEVRRRVEASPVLAGRVRLLGRLPRAALARLYAAADIFVLGSHHEAAGFSLIEALGFGVASVVSDIPAFRAITNDGATGAVFRVGDAAALARAIEEVAARDRAASRRAVRAHFEQALSWRAIAGRALSIYRDAERRARDR